MTTMKQARQAKEQARHMLLGLEGIQGIGITWDNDGQPCVRVNVAVHRADALGSQIPSHIGQVRVLVEAVDEIRLEGELGPDPLPSHHETNSVRGSQP